MYEGNWPVDPATAVGLMRIRISDAIGTPHEPGDGKADFLYFSDAALEALIGIYPETPDLSLAEAMSSVANRLIMEAQDIQVDDIKIKTVEKAKLMLENAAGLRAGALRGASDGFSVVPLSTTGGGFRHVQGQRDPWQGGF